jgi:hypothetical protein
MGQVDGNQALGTLGAVSRPTVGARTLESGPSVLIVVLLLVAGCTATGSESAFDRLDPIGAKAARQWQRGSGIQPLTITWDGAEFPLQSGDGAGGVMFGGLSPECERDHRAFIYTSSGRRSPLWGDAARVSDHWFRTRQCEGADV